MSPAAPSERNARIGAKIRRRRQVLGWDQRDLAERVGVHVGSVQKWEAGKFYPGRKLGRIEAVLGIELDDEDGTPEEPEVPPTIMASIDRTLPAGDPRREAVIDAIKQALSDTGPMPAVPAADSPGRHRRHAD